jgi:selenocysteine-specific elongation factor
MPHIIVGTAGHIDHGKTALVKALTGIDADRLKEEKARGITIDIGFANLELDADTTLGFIDVPGHERFVKNMLAGVGGIDVVMLVVAADESVMPQTREHLDICSLLKIKQGFTVLTKIDATDREVIDLAEMEVHELVRGTALEGAPVVRVSSVTGEGIPQLIETLRAYAKTTTPRDASRAFRLPVDRSFVIKGFGTVASGTLIAGRIRRDEEVEILPSRHSTRVRGIQVHGRSVQEAIAGQRTALNLPRIELADVERGMVIVSPGLFAPSTLFDVHLVLLPSAPAPLVRRKRIRFHVGTAEVMGFVVLLGQDILEPGGSAFAQIRLERETFALPGDRFIVRQYSPMMTLGGGEILDASPTRHRRSDIRVPERLRTLTEASADERVLSLVEEAGMGTLDSAGIVRRLGWLAPQVDDRLRALAGAGRLRVIADVPLTVVAPAAFDRAASALVDAVQRFHATNPLVKGIGREDLKGRVLRDAPAVLFRAAIERLVAERQLATDQDVVHVAGRSVTLGSEETRMRERLAEQFRRLGLQAPKPDEVIASLNLERQTARRIVQLMMKDNVLVKISEDLAVDRDAIQKLIDEVRALKVARPSFGVKEFKDLTGLSRKFAVPLLEYLDSQRVTRRVGDDRIIL